MRLSDLGKVDSGVTLIPTTTKSGAVVASSEFRRVAQLPTKGDDLSIREKVRQLCELPSGIDTLRPIQLQALTEAAMMRELDGQPKGVFCPIAVGGGKTLIAALLPLVLDAQRAVVLTTRGLLKSAETQLRAYMRSFRIPAGTRWVSYGVLSSPKRSCLLDDYHPDLVIADEAHFLANPTSARTMRFIRYFKENPDTRFCALSGTMMKESINDFGHLLALALRDMAPIPRDRATREEWAEALDPPSPQETRRPPGALLFFCRDLPDKTDVVGGYEHRLNASVGVVASTTNRIDVPLSVQIADVPYTDDIKAHVDTLVRKWVTPGGEEISCALAYQRAYHQLRLGGYYYWDWPTDPDTEWLAARAAYHREMRAHLASRARKGCDSPSLVEAEILAGRVTFNSWAEWDRVRHRPQPPTAWAWVDKCVARWASERVRPREIVWSMVRAFGIEVAKGAGCPYFGAGEAASADILREDGSRPIVASVRAHGVGKNLQHAFASNLVCAAVGSARDWEQLIGRTHRPGQTRPVSVTIPDIFEDEWNRALTRAEYLQGILGNEQKIHWLRRS